MSGSGGSGGNSGFHSGVQLSGIDYNNFGMQPGAMQGMTSQLNSSMQGMQGMQGMPGMHMMPPMHHVPQHLNGANQSQSPSVISSVQQLSGSGAGGAGGSGGNGPLEDASVIEMISTAIATLDNKKGSSLQAIKKFLSEKFGIDFSENATKLKVSKAVKTGVSKSIFRQEKNSYKLANAGAAGDMRGMYSQQQPGGQYGAQQQHWQQQFPNNIGYPGMPGHFMPAQGFYPQASNYQQSFNMDGAAQGAAADAAQKKKPRRRKNRKNKDGSVPKRRGRGGLTKPMNLSPELAAVCGGDVMGRTDVVKQLWVYIKRERLQNAENKRKIMCDERLQEVFHQPVVDMFEMTKLISAHLTKPTEEQQRAAEAAAAAANAAQQDQGALLQDYGRQNNYQEEEEDDEKDASDANAGEEQWTDQ